MSRLTEIAWAAGFFDGEGSTSLIRGQKNHYLKVHVKQNSRESLDRFQKAMNAGTVGGPYERRNNLSKNPFYEYYVMSVSEVERVLALLWPYLGTEKKVQAEEAFRNYDNRFIERAKVA